MIQKIKIAIYEVGEWWIFQSNRPKHFVVCLIGSFLFGAGFGIGAGFAAEYKDYKYGGKFDWLDIAADAIGTAVGSALRLIIFNNW